MDQSKGEQPMFSIAAVERDTGLSKDTLRVWERRYRFPLPQRDAHGERVYSPQQLEKLRAIKRLVDRGHRPGKIIGQSLAELMDLVDPGAAAAPDEHACAFQPIVALLKAHKVTELRQQFSQAVISQGLARFLLETVAPLNVVVGEAWMRGQVEIFEEHLYTETLQGVLRNAIAGIPHHNRPPRVLLTTFPGEQHLLGLLMAEGMFSIEGASCISLGLQTPIWDIVLAASAQRADIIALSFSAAFPANQASDGLEELRTKVPRTIEIWAGGSNPALRRRPIDGVAPITDLADVPAAIAAWRVARGAT